MGLLRELSAAGLAGSGRCEVSVKATAVGLFLPGQGEQTARQNIARICAAARNAGTTVTLDAEEHTAVDLTLRIAESSGPTSRTSAASYRPGCGAPRQTVPGWRPAAPGSGSAKARTTSPSTSRSAGGGRWTCPSSAA